MACRERDRMILAFALAVNERNIASSDLEMAASEPERRRLQKSVRNAAGQSEQLRALVLRHFAQHGC
jgi:hypothetical protein